MLSQQVRHQGARLAFTFGALERRSGAQLGFGLSQHKEGQE
jgi:hypothetical protein